MAEGRGLFVTVDGPSGVGKTTVSRLMGLRLRAQGLRVLVTTTPSGSTLGNLARGQTYELRGMALSCLVAADRYHHDRQVVRPALADGTIVVCDRYVPSSLVLDVLDGVEPAVIQILYSDITVPDLAIVL
ncbi:MAG: dTMP kinase, partial [Actinomycetota bacterium]|nr:dTMP kinase [Actinomycetota bacterium]